MDCQVFCDGLGEQQKSEKHRERAINRANRIWSLSQSLELGVPFTTDDFIARINMGLFVACLGAVCRKLLIEFTCCVGEADLYIARVTLQNQYYACLSNDSDFFCLQAPYIPLTSIKSNDNGSLSVELYTADNVVKVLQLHDVELLAHLSCLIGNDFFNDDDVYKMHAMLKILLPSPFSKNIIHHIQSVLVFLQKFKTCHDLLQTVQTHKNEDENLIEKYHRAIAQYAVHIPALEFKKFDEDPCVYNTARNQGGLFGLSLKLQRFDPNRDTVFRSWLPLHLVPVVAPFNVSQDMPQQNIVAMFTHLRNKIIASKIGPNVQVESEQLTTHGEVVWKFTSQRVPGLFHTCLFFCVFFAFLLDLVCLLLDFATWLDQFLWILGETTWTSLDVEKMFDIEPKSRVFAILVLRAFSRIEILSVLEKAAILCHFYPQTNNIAMASSSSISENEILTKSVDTRVVRIVSLFEYCLCLCVDANLCCNAPFGNVLHTPSAIIDGQRLTAELEKKFLPDISDGMLHFLDDGVTLDQCKYNNACRFTKCPKTHPRDVFGQCVFDGICSRQECTMRHLLQPGIIETLCKFDGMCIHFDRCRFKHVKQNTAVRVTTCRFDGLCTRFPNCGFQHYKQQLH